MKKKGKLLLLILACIKITVAIGQSNHEKNAAQIVGKITNYIPSDNNRFITFRTSNFQGESKDTSIYISKNGSFKAKLFQFFEGDFEVMFNKSYLTLYFVPGATLNLKIDNNKWAEAKKPTSAITLSGKGSEESKLIADFMYEFYKTKFTAVNWSDSSKSDEEVSLERIRRMNEEKSFLDNYSEQHKIKNNTFKKWAINNITYNAGFDIAFENFTSARKKSLTAEQLIRILNEIKINNSAALHNSSYYLFLYKLQGTFQIIININPVYKDSIKNGVNRISLYTRCFDQYVNGIARQIMYLDLYSIIPKASYDFLFDSLTFEPQFKNQYNVLKRAKDQTFNPFNIIDRLENASTDVSLKRKLTNLFKSYHDQFLFIDFWGTWCAPCMHEMPVYPQLIKKFEKDKIRFLFIATDSKNEKVQKIKDSLKIEGDFIVLADNEIKLLNNVFQFRSYPMHFIVSPKGIVIDNSISRISQGEKLDQGVADKISSLLSK